MIKLCDKKDCTGCFACDNICPKKAISMQPDREGFLQPKINKDTCIECGLCMKTCPVLNPIDLQRHKIHCYAAFANDVNIRKRGSSGGLFTIFANWIIESGGVVIGAAFDENHVVRHFIASTKEELIRLQGSKYVQSNIGYIYKDVKKILSEKKKVLFVGTSCQVAGLRSFLHRPNENLFTIDLVCHGVPSPKIFEKYIDYLKNKDKYFYAYNFRDLGGWSCNSSSSSSKLPNGKEQIKMLYGVDSGYFTFFINGYMNRECCYHCVYAKSTPRAGDITLADFWGIGKKTPFIYDTRFGVSFVSPNTKQGEILFEAVKSLITYEKRDVNETIEEGGNHQLAHPAFRPKQRSFFYDKAYKLSWEELVKYYKLPLRQRPKLYRRIFSKLKRIILR